jgi:hypothetical protein
LRNYHRLTGLIPSPAAQSVTHLEKRRGKATSFANGKLEFGRSAEAFVNQQNWQELQDQNRAITIGF